MQPVWDISVGGDNSYRAQGLVHHNSSRDPNLQNQPKSMRPLYIAEEGNSFIEADYSQMEIRCLAHYSKDKALLEALKQEDIHRAVAAWLFKVPYDEVTDIQRNRGKTLNFALLYGMGAESLSASLSVTVHEAEALIREYHSRFHQVNAWINQMEAQIKMCGLVSSDIGRIRRIGAARFVEPKSGAMGLCVRRAVNSPIQSLAADITSYTLVKLTQQVPGYQDYWWLCNTVHDSILLEVHDEHVPEVTAQLEAVMTAPPYPGFDVPLAVDITVSKRWGGELDLAKLTEEEEDERVPDTEDGTELPEIADAE